MNISRLVYFPGTPIREGCSDNIIKFFDDQCLNFLNFHAVFVVLNKRNIGSVSTFHISKLLPKMHENERISFWNEKGCRERARSNTEQSTTPVALANHGANSFIFMQFSAKKYKIIG